MRLPQSVALLLLLLPASAPGLAADRALLVGVGKYPGLTIGGTPGLLDLAGPATDLRNMQALLVDHLGYDPAEITILADADATATAILSAIENWLIGGTGPNDRALLYFSGHGAQVLVPDGKGGQRPTSAIVPADVVLDVSNKVTAESGLILGFELGQLLQRFAGRELTVIADSCYSGSITRGAVGPEAIRGMRTITPRGPLELQGPEADAALVNASKTSVRLLDIGSRGAAANDRIAVWSASTVAQVTWDTSEGGVFTTNFVSGLGGRRAVEDGGEVTASQLLYYVRSAAAEYCAGRQACRDGLTPELLASDAYRASVLVPYGAAAAEVAEPVPFEPSGPEIAELAIDLLGHANDFELEADMLPGNVVTLGDEIRIRVVSAETGSLLVLDTGPDGKLKRLFPNDYSDADGREGRVAADRPFTLPDQSYPFTFEATEIGAGSLLILVAESGFSAAELRESPAFEAVTWPRRALAAIAAELQEPLLDPSPDRNNRSRRWALVRLDYTVIP
jgi:hypothetical protein